MNIAGLSGYAWLDAPLKWQVLDIVYLALNATVVAGLPQKRIVSGIAFVVAALSQILLYTVLRDWILDVPSEFAVSADQAAHLNSLVSLHVFTLMAVAYAWFHRRGPTD